MLDELVVMSWRGSHWTTGTVRGFVPLVGTWLGVVVEVTADAEE